MVLCAERWKIKEHSIMMMIIIIIINNNQRRDNCFWLMVFIINISSFLLVFHSLPDVLFLSSTPHSRKQHKYLSVYLLVYRLYTTRVGSLLTVYNFDCRLAATATKHQYITKLVDYSLCATCFVYL